MSTVQLLTIIVTISYSASVLAADDFPLTEDSKPQPGVPKGTLLKDAYTAKADSLFPGTQREYQIYLPAGCDTSKPAPFMVFQDGVIYQAPTVFDNLIARKEIPPLIGIFIKPGVVPAANDNAQPRYNRSYEYDSITDHYARFLIDEFLPAIVAKHRLNLSVDPNARAIAGNSSGGICAFMVAWHRPDQFRRVFTGVGTYVGIHGADKLPVLVRKYEPKPLRIWLQSGENDNDLYCGDWWMANQMMERSLTWNGYEVNHTWGKGGHNAKHATQIFPEVLKWLWKGYPNEPVKANPRGDAKWVGAEVVGYGEWLDLQPQGDQPSSSSISVLSSDQHGDVFFGGNSTKMSRISLDQKITPLSDARTNTRGIALTKTGSILVCANDYDGDSSLLEIKSDGDTLNRWNHEGSGIAIDSLGRNYISSLYGVRRLLPNGELAPCFVGLGEHNQKTEAILTDSGSFIGFPGAIALSADQSFLFVGTSPKSGASNCIYSFRIRPDGDLECGQRFPLLEPVDIVQASVGGLCVDTNGWLYVATSLGIQVLDQAGRVNFIIPTPKQPLDVCFGGKDLSELFVACGDTVYKRKTKAHGYVSGQMAPIKPPAPKL